MRYLLDTHAFLWWIADDDRLVDGPSQIMAGSQNELFFSAASCWEIAIKAQLGKLKLPRKLDIFIADQLAINSVIALPISASHALHVANLPNHHRDPFDRMLVAQAQLEKLPVITSDPLLLRYDIEVVWG